MSTHFRKLVIKDIRRETADCVSILFDVPDEWKEEFRFQPGQNLIIRYHDGTEEIRRSYSICSSPLENELRIAVKKISTGRFSAHANIHLKEGDELEVLPPSGRFSISVSAENKKNYIAFAAGSGITPILSIIKTVLAVEPQSRFTLFYGNQSRGTIIFKEALEALKNKYVDRLSIFHILSREQMDSPLNEGRIDSEKCMAFSQILPLLKADEYFICGPHEMILNVSQYLETKGVAKHKIHYELFTTPGQQLSSKRLPNNVEEDEAKKCVVTVKADGVAFQFVLGYNEASILDAATATGADLPYACKGGVCSTCRAKLVEGQVEMNVNYSLEQDEIDAGYILTCQSYPRSEKVVVDYDAK